MVHDSKSATNPLGETLASPAAYAPEILFPIPRAPAREAIGFPPQLAMFGFDHWQAFELSWLDSSGKPSVAVAELFFDCRSPAIVESKSLKLYLNSFNHERMASTELLASTIKADLEQASGNVVNVLVHSLGEYRALMAKNFAPRLQDNRTVVALDRLPIIDNVAPLDASVIEFIRLDKALNAFPAIKETRYTSDLFRSNCPVTNQPDWASLEIKVTGIEIEGASLLSYLCSFREHQGYHEECAERIFVALSNHCRPDSLQVSMNYLRRGGLDINVYRASEAITHADRLARDVRQ